MSPSARFHGFVSASTITIMFGFLTYVLPALQTLQSRGSVADRHVLTGVTWAFAALSSVGTYRLLAGALEWLLQRTLWARRWIFGPSFLHGTWVGSFEGHANVGVRLVVEKYDQDLDGLVVNGRSYTQDGHVHGHWTSEAIEVDARRGRLIYAYTADIASRSMAVSGICTFQFDRGASDEAPRTLSGLTHDLNDTTRIVVRERKISDALLPWDTALAEARKPAAEEDAATPAR